MSCLVDRLLACFLACLPAWLFVCLLACLVEAKAEVLGGLCGREREFMKSCRFLGDSSIRVRLMIVICPEQRFVAEKPLPEWLEFILFETF